MAISTNGSERTLGQLVADASTDLSGIVKGEIDLAKLEMKSEVSKAGKGGGLLAAAGLFALYMLMFLLLAAAWGIHAAGLSLWLSLLIVAGVLLLITLILALLGRSSLKKMRGGPKKTIANAQQTVKAIKPAKG
ncbi:phage holin family protein [Luteipulveratus flavus]|uniref:Phage holin family protein n=1 Tax=Luteipulveratus flavus TaxID=3031728 RepID=A0ABT6C794_9MICO|nr:phage holin family protein [Luteipulveratus sp. YIM 133296]MDF8264811.1 phage holin family protein [Luteipulveratus sp. YIM 133296]